MVCISFFCSSLCFLSSLRCASAPTESVNPSATAKASVRLIIGLQLQRDVYERFIIGVSERASQTTIGPTRCVETSCYHPHSLAVGRAVMKLIDVSVPIDANLPNYPGNTPFTLEAIKRIARGDSSNVSSLHMSLHGGTH